WVAGAGNWHGYQLTDGGAMTRAILFIAAIASAACCGDKVHPPSKAAQNSVRKAQELFEGQAEASRKARLPDSPPQSKSEGRKKQ
ncbi:MAG TPA: hypothetical protein VNH18_28045, partial [Bryobacteraceae bacterium]|nr:hypothetical protein [Bryobacteraceae bacterium]